MSSNAQAAAAGASHAQDGAPPAAGECSPGFACVAAWGACPNCHALVSVQAPDCQHCGAVFGEGAAWSVRELPGRVPSVAEAAVLAAAVRQRKERAAEIDAKRHRRARQVSVGSLGEQLLRANGRLVLQHTDTEAEADLGLLHSLVAALALAMLAALLGGGFAIAFGSCLLVILLVALSDREVGFQRTVVMDVAEAALTVDTTWPRCKKAHHRHIPVSALRLRLDRWDTQIEGVAGTCWSVTLVLPHDADDSGDARIELAVFGDADAEAARALCHRLIAQLGLPDLPLRWHRLNPSEQQSGGCDEAA